MPRKPIAVVSADWHLQNCAWKRRPEIQGDSYESLSQLVDYSLKYQVPLIGAGDLFDTCQQDDSEPLHHAMQQVARMGLDRLPVYFIQGQHEQGEHGGLRTRPWLSLHAWATHAHQTTFQLAGINCYGLDYTRPDALRQAFAKIPENTDVLVAHQVWIDLMGEHIGGECRFTEVPHARMLITGDYHKHLDLVTINSAGRDMVVLSPGSTCVQALDEPPDKFCYLLYDDLSYSSLPLVTRRVRSAVINRKDELEKLLTYLPKILEIDASVPERIRKPIMHVKFPVNLPDVHRQVTGVVGEQAFLFLQPLREEMPVLYDTGAGMARQEVIDRGLVGNLGRLCSPGSEEYQVVHQLLTSNDASQTLERLESGYLGTTDAREDSDHRKSHRALDVAGRHDQPAEHRQGQLR